MRHSLCHLLVCVAMVLPLVGRAGLLADRAAGNFPLVADHIAAEFLIDTGTDKAVARAAEDLRNDIKAVTDVLPEIRADVSGPSLRTAVIVGVLGKNSTLDRIVAEKKLNLGSLANAWESFVVAVVKDPLPGVEQALVIAGSDRRGAIFGCYEVSQAIGVSPWHWWADVPAQHRDSLYLDAGFHRFGPPSVKYRGIFINDEDWGLQPWAAKTFEPEHGGIGPKTYAKVFELMLRLKANTVWPGMHACTKPFNAFPENKEVANDYGIIMGSSHAEPMLRNNVGEWKDDHARYNYAENRGGVLAYWEERVKENGAFENIYTLGMRGIHDSGMQGAKNDADRVRLLEQIFADQRALLAKYVRPDLAQVPQIFCAYKEVLGLYRGGLKVPDDVTIVWPDDNFGYIRSYATPQERTRAGGFGIYYHLSYLGAPLSYLWLYTTPPALVWEEMTKAYENGAHTLWIANVGDIKPAEIGIEFFFQVAWDIHRWQRENLPDFLSTWATREFGAGNATEIADIMSAYYQLNYQRKPEHLQWWLPKETPHPSPFTREETEVRLNAFAALRQRAERVQNTIPADRRDAFFELVAYPVVGSALANERYFCGEQFALSGSPESTDAQDWLKRATAADAQLQRETARFSDEIAQGKWRNFIHLEPADADWRSFRIAKWEPQKFPATVAAKAVSPRTSGVIAIEAEHFDQKTDRASAAWQIVPGLGRTGEGSVAVFPSTVANVDVTALATAAPRLDYKVQFATAGEFSLIVNLIPTQPIQAGRGLRFGVALDDEPPREVVADIRDGSKEWAQGVLNATIVATSKLVVKTPGEHTLRIFGEDAGVVLDKITIDCGGLQPSYLGPNEKRDSH